uniref:MARVEL domain-containing protein n=1 Tax=Caenorhabditis tropicalis TaxID=1561998 RepID=A0A1I7T5L2_9PELO
MTRPTAPCLTADYYTYSTYTQRDDYYGGFEPKTEGDKYNNTSGPLRRKPNTTSTKIKEGKSMKFGGFWDSSSAHCISFIYCALAVIIIAFNAFMYYNGIRNLFIVYLCVALGVMVFTSILMHVGITIQQPFLCIPFVVLRTLETFVTAICLGLFTYAILKTDSNQFNFFLQCTKMAGQLVSPHSKLDYVDATFQLCIIGWCISLTFLSLSVYVCRVAFHCTMSIADQLRYKRYQRTTGTSQSRFAGDEFNCA